MIYNLFGSNRPVVLSLLTIPALGFGLLTFLYSSPPDSYLGGPLFKGILALLSVPLLQIIAGIAVNILSAVMVNRLYNIHDYGARENYFPGLFYFLFMSLQLSWNYINPMMVGNLFLLLALHRLLRMYRVQEITSMIYDASVFLCIAALVFPPFVLSFVLLWLSMAQLRSFNLREWLVPITGLLTPVLYVLVFYWWTGFEFDFSAFTLVTQKSQIGLFSQGNFIFYATLLVSFCIVFLGAVRFIREMRISTVHKQNTKKVFATTSVVLGIVWLLGVWMAGYQPKMTVLFAIPISVFGGVYFSHVRRRIVQLTLFYLWIVLLLLYPVFTDVI